MDRGVFIKELHINLMGLFTRRKTSVLLFHHSAVHHEVKIILALEAEMQMSPLGCAFRISEIPKKARCRYDAAVFWPHHHIAQTQLAYA